MAKRARTVRIKTTFFMLHYTVLGNCKTSGTFSDLPDQPEVTRGTPFYIGLKIITAVADAIARLRAAFRQPWALTEKSYPGGWIFLEAS